MLEGPLLVGFFFETCVGGSTISGFFFFETCVLVTIIAGLVNSATSTYIRNSIQYRD